MSHSIGNSNTRGETDNTTEISPNDNDAESTHEETVQISKDDPGVSNRGLATPHYVMHVAFLAFSFLVVVIASVFVIDCALLISHRMRARLNSASDRIKTQNFPFNNDTKGQETTIQLL